MTGNMQLSGRSVRTGATGRRGGSRCWAQDLIINASELTELFCTTQYVCNYVCDAECAKNNAVVRLCLAG